MGARSGGGLGAPSNARSRLTSNVAKARAEFKVTAKGYFGRTGKNSRVIHSAHPAASALRLWSLLSQGARIERLKNGKGSIAWFADGSHVVYRPTTSGSPAVSITSMTAGLGLPATQKVHFVAQGGTK